MLVPLVPQRQFQLVIKLVNHFKGRIVGLYESVKAFKCKSQLRALANLNSDYLSHPQLTENQVMCTYCKITESVLFPNMAESVNLYVISPDTVYNLPLLKKFMNMANSYPASHLYPTYSEVDAKAPIIVGIFAFCPVTIFIRNLHVVSGCTASPKHEVGQLKVFCYL